MDLANLRALTNRYQDVRLISLRNWKREHPGEPRDDGGPYVVTQEAYDPADLSSTACQFVLGKSGSWLNLGLFLRLPRETRRQEFVFGTAAEVIALLESLPGKPSVLRPADPLAAPAKTDEADDLTAVFTNQQSER